MRPGVGKVDVEFGSGAAVTVPSSHDFPVGVSACDDFPVGVSDSGFVFDFGSVFDFGNVPVAIGNRDHS